MPSVNNYVLQATHTHRPILVDAYWSATPSAKPVIIFAHGFKGFKDWGHFEWVARAFADAGFVFIKFNFSHNGTTQQQPTEFADLDAFGNNNHLIELDDLGAIIDLLSNPRQQLVPAEQINTSELYLIGHSRGGGIATIKAAEDTRIRKLATWAAVSQLGGWQNADPNAWREKGVIYIANARTQQQMPLYYQLYHTFVAHAERLSVMAAAARLHIPHLIAHGTADPTVPPRAAQQLHHASPHSQLYLLADADHVFGGFHPYTASHLPTHTQQLIAACVSFFL